jgi:hypothetical protein
MKHPNDIKRPTHHSGSLGKFLRSRALFHTPHAFGSQYSKTRKQRPFANQPSLRIAPLSIIGALLGRRFFRRGIS